MVLSVVGFDRNEALAAGRLRERGVEVHLGREEETLLQGIDLVVKSPGVPSETLLVSSARARVPCPCGARSSSVRGSSRTRSSASPGRTARRRRPSCSARSSGPRARRSRSPATSAVRSPLSSGRPRRRHGSCRALVVPAPRRRDAASACRRPPQSRARPPRPAQLSEAYADVKLRIFERQEQRTRQ